MKLIKLYTFTLISLVLLDGLWLEVIAKNFYQAQLGFLFAEKINLIPVIIFYPLYSTMLVFFVLRSASPHSLGKTFLSGALFGLMAYGTYDLTNQATLKNWPVIVTLVDMAWGTFVTGTACTLSAWINRYLTSINHTKVQQR